MPPYTIQRDVCTFGHWPTMCFADHCDYGATAGLSDKVWRALLAPFHDLATPERS